MNESYNFRALSPKDFEDLLADLISAEHSCHVQTFKSGPDGGIDLKATTPAGVRLIGQAKHYVSSTFSDLKRACAREAKRAEEISKSADRYLLGTTQSLTLAQKYELLALLAGLPITEDDILAGDDIASLLRRHKSVERAHFKLWLSGTATLQRLLYGRLYGQSDGEIDQIENEMRRFVRHEGVDHAYEILRKHGKLIISGPPGIGKTTLARMVCSLHMSEEWELSVARSVEEVGDALGLEGERVILFDDFLGQVRLSDTLLHDVDARLPSQLQRAVNSKNIRLIITTRDYILKGAQSRSEKLERSLTQDETFVLSLDSYSFLDRARILYNHIYFSTLSDDEVSAFIDKDFYKEVVNHKNYNPRIIKTITDSDYTRLSSNEIQSEIKKILDKPELLWSTPYHEHISDAAQLLAVVVSVKSWRRHKGVSISEAQDAFSDFNERLEFGIKKPRRHAEFKKSAKQLEGNFLSISNGNLNLSNPGVRDFLEGVILEDGIAKALLASSSRVSELQYLRNLSPELIQSNSGLWFEAYSCLYESDDFISLSELGSIIEAIRFIDPMLKGTKHRDFLESICKTYLAKGDLDGEMDEVGNILSAIEDELFDKEMNSSLLSQIEAELEVYDENNENSQWGSTIEDIEWVVRKFYEYQITTDIMRDTLANVIERSLENASNDFSEMSYDDVDRERELTEEFESYLRETRSWQYSNYTEIYTKELEERSERDQYMEDMYRDGYHRSPYRSQNFGGVAATHSVEAKPMDDTEQAQAMFQSLRS